MRSDTVLPPGKCDPDFREYYRCALEILVSSRIPFLVGGACALGRFTGIERYTKDLDVFVLPADSARVLKLFDDAGYHTELTFPHWLGKAFRGDDFIDIIFGSGNGLCRVDEAWFEHSVASEVFGVPVRLCPVEEMIWSKAFIMERERFDGADIAHLLRNRCRWLDWERLLKRFGDHWPVLLCHVILFRYIYPGERDQIPPSILHDLLVRLHHETKFEAPKERTCRGTLLSRAQYLLDVEQWGYRDARLVPDGAMTSEQIERWTAPVFEDPFPAERNAAC